MVISTKPVLILLLLLTITHIFLSTPYSSFVAAATTNIVSDLHSLQSQFPSGIIHLNETILYRIFNSGARSFYLIIFFDAIQLHDKLEPNLKTIKSEYAIIAKSFSINNQNSSNLSKIFFCDIEFSESEKDFLRFSIHTLPNIRIVPPDVDDLKSDSIPLDISESSNLVESMAGFIESKTGLSIGRIHRPPILSKSQFGFLIGGLLISLPFMTKKILAGETPFHQKRIWMFGIMFVYFFSVSGSMFILIRKVPLFVMDRKDPNKLIFFYKGVGMQFGVEGLYVGFLFMTVGLLLPFITRFIVRIKDSMIQRATMVSAMIVSFWAVREVVGLNHWKTGYYAHAYLPSNWYN
ncbi:probable dolichyl-diphosphooligosaccharide--protein glycosyltransferase subunit 3B [Lactuca sativa]|uniref:probable dolichyl-diphosphooligosaccharide--protein glycosyltransferase subunit 3B n=1 Tax=Lactuca sativa TaxID=4236 RepID=UPI000CC8FF76|nr:probable dolichyl-diphosphooligosaccharide--protein glycosyltransferase subunit 3B [Lactuca sativa]